jgi:hypothetical protein
MALLSLLKFTGMKENPARYQMYKLTEINM